jgi:hypothetical protein
MKSGNITRKFLNILANIALLDLATDIQSGDTKRGVNPTLRSLNGSKRLKRSTRSSRRRRRARNKSKMKTKKQSSTR